MYAKHIGRESLHFFPPKTIHIMLHNIIKYTTTVTMVTEKGNGGGGGGGGGGVDKYVRHRIILVTKCVGDW